jgi:hypothetical protein
METIYILLEKPPKGQNHAFRVEGRSAAKNWEKLRTFAHQMNTRPLDDFLVNNAANDKWYPPSDALTTLQRLISCVSSDRKSVDNIRHLIRDLNSFENILSSAEARGSRFRFAIEQEKEEDLKAPIKSNSP